MKNRIHIFPKERWKITITDDNYILEKKITAKIEDGINEIRELL